MVKVGKVLFWGGRQISMEHHVLLPINCWGDDLSFFWDEISE